MVPMKECFRLPESINFSLEEENTLIHWKSEKIFNKCMQRSKDKPRYTFYDGPPFATGLPHYGHILAGTIKDIITRYAYQKGFHVERRFGWDCHGLPVEYEIDKSLNIRGPEDVIKMGIENYNHECRKIVMLYANEWEEIVNRLGRWIDFENDYKTLYPWYMESIWWVFKQLFDKGLVYEGVKVMPYSTACTTTLSNFEAGQNYKEVVDPCVIVSLQSLSTENMYFLIWTTTPWTLPSNFACCVNPDLFYVKVMDIATGRLYILAESRLSFVYKTPDQYQIIDKVLGINLKGERYKPMFPYFEKRGKEVNAFRILVDGYVTEDSGTGIVHNAPYFGEDDYRVCLNADLITKASPAICPIDQTGKFTSEIPDFNGQYVKDADKNIISKLKSMGILVSVAQIKHSYPFCWRSDTPLIYKAVPSWFIRVEHMTTNLLKCSSQTHWVPDFVRDKRFGNWLKEARDWAVSRNRYWGTPIPIWKSDNEIICIGSVKQLEQLSGKKVIDLHRENVDDIEIPSLIPGQAPLRRINAVFDCWFESGSMPYAQQHFPFENEKKFLSNFPADFIAEGIDQTRGWFYTLLVISTALFNKAPFKNLIANGLVLASDGQKMSKRKKNYPDPMDVVNKYGADALRLYLINSPVVRAENLRFKEEGVRDIIKDIFLPWYNAYRFLLQNIARYEQEDVSKNEFYLYDQKRHIENLDNASIIDIWIVSFKESLLKFFAKEMKEYRLYTVVPRLTKFIDQLTNWYVRLSRQRIKGELGKKECIQSLDTLFDVLFTVVKMMAPFTPFLTDYIYKRLIHYQPLSTLHNNNNNDSVHYEMIPQCNDKLIRPEIEKSVALMQSVIELGRVMRDRRTLPLKYPLSEMIIICKDEITKYEIEHLENFILRELNVRKLTISLDKDKYGIKLRIEPNHKILGQRLKGTFKNIMAKIKSLTDCEIQDNLDNGYFNILNERIELNEVRIIYELSNTMGENFEANSDNEVIVIMDTTPNQQLFEEGLAREIINRVQKLKKKAKLIPIDSVYVFYDIKQDVILTDILKNHTHMIQTAIKSKFSPYCKENITMMNLLISEKFILKDIEIQIFIYENNNILLSIPWINITLHSDIRPRYTNSTKGCLLLQNSKSKDLITIDVLRKEIELLFGLYGVKFNILQLNKNHYVELRSIEANLSGNLLLISNEREIICAKCYDEIPFCKFDKENMCFAENPLGINIL